MSAQRMKRERAHKVFGRFRHQAENIRAFGFQFTHNITGAVRRDASAHAKQDGLILERLLWLSWAFPLHSGLSPWLFPQVQSLPASLTMYGSKTAFPCSIRLPAEPRSIPVCNDSSFLSLDPPVVRSFYFPLNFFNCLIDCIIHDHRIVKRPFLHFARRDLKPAF